MKEIKNKKIQERIKKIAGLKKTINLKKVILLSDDDDEEKIAREMIEEEAEKNVEEILKNDYKDLIYLYGREPDVLQMIEDEKREHLFYEIIYFKNKKFLIIYEV